ncbi:hypothetical protein L0O83_18020, partial [Lawsonibacter sp. DFI.5.51]|nr:hypothetical protein [Lawsonibacter sp. DFI.5.51]
MVFIAFPLFLFLLAGGHPHNSILGAIESGGAFLIFLLLLISYLLLPLERKEPLSQIVQAGVQTH